MRIKRYEVAINNIQHAFRRLADVATEEQILILRKALERLCDDFRQKIQVENAECDAAIKEKKKKRLFQPQMMTSLEDIQTQTGEEHEKIV